MEQEQRLQHLEQVARLGQLAALEQSLVQQSIHLKLVELAANQSISTALQQAPCLAERFTEHIHDISYYWNVQLPRS
jgi:hypothetical protein